MNKIEKFVCCGCPDGWCDGCVAEIDALETIDEPCCGECGCTVSCCICQQERETAEEREWYDYLCEQTNQRTIGRMEGRQIA